MKVIKKIFKTLGILFIAFIILGTILNYFEKKELKKEVIEVLSDTDTAKITTNRNKKHVLDVPTVFSIDIENKSDQYVIIDIKDFEIDGQKIVVKGSMSDHYVENLLAGDKMISLYSASQPVPYAEYQGKTSQTYEVFTLSAGDDGRQKKPMNSPQGEIKFTMNVYTSENSKPKNNSELIEIDSVNIVLPKIE